MAIPHRSRMILWKRDVRAAEAFKPTFTDDKFSLKSAHTMLDIVIGRDVPPDRFFQPPAYGGLRLKSFYAQLRAETYAYRGDGARALDEIETACESSLYDIAWLEGCPLLELVRKEPRYAKARDIVSTRAAAVRAAYNEP
jgi:hypothetical protein